MCQGLFRRWLSLAFPHSLCLLCHTTLQSTDWNDLVVNLDTWSKEMGKKVEQKRQRRKKGKGKMHIGNKKYQNNERTRMTSNYKGNWKLIQFAKAWHKTLVKKFRFWWMGCFIALKTGICECKILLLGKDFLSRVSKQYVLLLPFQE